jgi:hypothetical protein
MSRAGGIGLAPFIEEQLKKQTESTVDVLQRRQFGATEK